MQTTLFIIVMFIAGVACGILVERIRWSKLIDKGRLPKPHERWEKT